MKVHGIVRSVALPVRRLLRTGWGTVRDIDQFESRSRLADAREAVAFIEQAVSLVTALSPRQRELIACLRMGLTLTEAARAMRIRRGTAWQHLCRVRVKVATIAAG